MARDRMVMIRVTDEERELFMQAAEAMQTIDMAEVSLSTFFRVAAHRLVDEVIGIDEKEKTD